jgi:type II secretory pathway pseudopilin PulG
MLKLKSKKTFTLMELMISVVILLLVLGSLLFGFTQCMILNEQNSNLATATNDAQYALEQVKTQAFDNVVTFCNNFDPAAFNNLISENIILTPTNLGSNLIRVVVDVSWTGRRGSPSAQISTVIAKTA